MNVVLILVAILACLAFIGWLIYRAARRRAFNAHTITYAVAILAGIFTYAFFLSMDLSQLVKILVSILLGAALIFLAAYLQLRRRAHKS